MKDDFQLKCKICGEVLSTQMLLDTHIEAHYQLIKDETFAFVGEQVLTKQEVPSLRMILDSFIKPRISKAKQRKRKNRAGKKKRREMRKKLGLKGK